LNVVVNLLFNTTPVVIHAQGRHEYKPHWQPIKERFFAAPARNLGAIPDLTILTWNNGHEAMGLLERSLEHLGVPCLVLGAGITDWVNSRDKPSLTLEAVNSIQTPYVAGVDSRDAIFIDDPRLLIERFEQEFSSDLVFSADRMNWPNCADFKEFEDSLPGAQASEFRYLNSGAWIGRTEFCRQFFKDAVQTEPVKEAPEADQGVLKQLFKSYYPRVQLDYKSSMFQNIGFVFNPIFQIT
jgi:hypothetical protein